MRDVQKLGRIFLFNLISNTPNLMERFQTTQARIEEGEQTTTPYAHLTSRQLYSRLLTDIDFASLSEEEKSEFIFARPGTTNEFDKRNAYYNQVRGLVQEAHNRSARALGVRPTNIVFCNFSQNCILSETGYTEYDTTNGNIYVNTGVDYSLQRPTFLLEQINARTFQHSVYTKIETAVSNPESLSPTDYYIATMTAVKNYLYEENASPFAMGHFLLGLDSLTPEFVSAQLYAFEKTRADLQASGLYGGEVRDFLRDAEEDFHSDLQHTIGIKTLTNNEDILSFFKGSNLNQQSNGMFGKIADAIDVDYAHLFYNAIGAEMPQGVSTTEYLNELDNIFREAHGLPPKGECGAEYCPAENPWDNDESVEDLTEEFGRVAFKGDESEEDEASYDKPGDAPAEDDEEFDEASEIPYGEEGSPYNDEEDFEDITYADFKSVLPPEGVIQDVTKMPFHKPYEPPTQQDGAEQ